MEKVR